MLSAAVSKMTGAAFTSAPRSHALAIRTRKQERIGIEPLAAPLGFRQHEAVGHKGLRLDIEFPQGGGIAAAARKAQDRARFVTRLGLYPRPDPVMVLFERKLVDVQQGFPSGVRPAKLIERRSPPEAARVVRIFPKVVEEATAPFDIRDIVRPVVNRRQHVAIRGEAGAAELLQRQPALLLDEIERAAALDFLQPQIRIVIGGK